MELARLRSNITLVPVLTMPGAVSIVLIILVMSTTAAATPPSSELNGVAKIAPATDTAAPVVLEPGEVAMVPVPPAMIVEAADPPIEAATGADSSEGTDDASRTAAAAVLSTAGEIASFDRTPIFGRPGGTSGGTPADAPATTRVAGNATSWWNAPELRVFGLLAVLVLAAVFMKRHGGRGIGLAGGPRPSGVVSVLGRFPFGRSASLVLLECGSKVLLLHQHAGKGGDVTTLAEFSDLDEVADLRSRLSATERDKKDGFGRELEQTLGLYDRRGRPRGFGGEDGLPVQGPIETVDLTRRRPRRGVRGN